MWQRFTEPARNAIFYAQEEASRLCESNVNTEHLLLGLVHDDDSAAVRILDRFGLLPEIIRFEVSLVAAPGSAAIDTPMQLAPRSKRVIDLAYNEAGRLKSKYVGTEHLLLGLIREGGGKAAHVFTALGIDIERARQEVANLPADEGRPAALAAPFDPRQKRLEYGLMRRAAELAKLRGETLGPEHVFLAIVEDPNGRSTRALASFGITKEQLEQAIHDVDNPHPPQSE